jgi:hypothetical protein
VELTEMKTPETKKKAWAKPEVHVLSISKDTFSGSGTGAEGADRNGPPYK